LKLIRIFKVTWYSI